MQKHIVTTISVKKLFALLIMGMAFMILASLIIVGTKDSKIDTSKYGMEPNDITFDGKNGTDVKIKVYITKANKIEEMYLEEYVRGVVAAEMPASFQIEALKAQAIAARTYALAHLEMFGGTKAKDAHGADVFDDTRSQAFMHKEERLSQWPQSKGGEYWNKITEAIEETKGKILTYNGELVMEPFYFAVSSGNTEDAAAVFSTDVPYLKSVQSQGDKSSPSYQSTYKFSYSQLANKINSSYSEAGLSAKKLRSQISIIKRSNAGTILEIKLGRVTITGTQFRSLLGLNSANFSFKFNSSSVEIICKGYGHDVGMSQWGANALAKSGKGCEQILTYYYQGVKIENIEKLEK